MQFGESAWTFWDACGSVQLTGSDGLSRSSALEGLPLVLRHVARVIAVTVGPHGHNGPGAAQLILIVDRNDAPFVLAIFVERSPSHIVFLSPAARGGHSDHHHVHL